MGVAWSESKRECVLGGLMERLIRHPTNSSLTFLGVTDSIQFHWVVLVGNIHDSDRIFIASKADFISVVSLIRSLVVDAMSIMRVQIFGETTSIGRTSRIANVYKDKSSVAAGRSDNIRIAGFFVDDNVVCRADSGVAVVAVVSGSRLKGFWGTRETE